VFLVASRFNHACADRNNVEYSYDNKKNCMLFVTTDKIKAGDELFIRYGADPRHLFINWGFRCKCGGCRGISDKEARAILPVEPDDYPW
jgi:SET domain-containing protein